MLTGLFPEANIDAYVSASQFSYDLQRMSGEKEGGSIVIYGNPGGLQGWGEVLLQILF
jgi:hypothetical protein